MSNWAENEARLACKHENPNYDFDSDTFDYGCSCYKSALKAYNSIMEDGHSGFSFSITKKILNRLMNDLPLTPIEDKDFFSEERGDENHPLEDPRYLKENKLVSELQCLRMPSLFRSEYKDGTIQYHDIDRAYFINIDNPKDTYVSGTDFLDKMFPITMPYWPTIEKYKIYERTFLVDEKNGDFDTRWISHVITPEGKRIDLNIYKMETPNGWVDITQEECQERYNNRIK